ncbi:N-acetyltransferase [Fulvimonas sp. R45]|uniref:GNAT family N-acetyltransferase n=1 Tax=Fulvimonas sp. R45 TaxID=3045937 RepID=UPI00265DA9FF|nr:N-acetyltransferase [Fulvimonas sp. R45]MDO1529035.1 N-acetyltransferase [Fulvimonas sp. R45]
MTLALRRLRPEPRELEAALAVHRAAFGRDDEARLVHRLREAGDDALEWLAEADGQVVGHVAYSPVRIEHGDDGCALGLAPVGVLPAWQRRGVGRALIEASLDALRQGGRTSLVVVLGDPAYYARFGFAPASAAGLHDTYGGGDAFMARALRPGALDGRHGRVDYAPAFDLLGE